MQIYIISYYSLITQVSLVKHDQKNDQTLHSPPLNFRSVEQNYPACHRMHVLPKLL